MKDQVAVVGVGCTKFGDRFERSYEDLICDAAFDAYADAGIEPSEIQAAYLGTYLPGPGGGKAAVSLADALRLYDRPITRVENYCATGRSEEHTSELQSRRDLVCRLLLEKKKKNEDSFISEYAP